VLGVGTVFRSRGALQVLTQAFGVWVTSSRAAPGQADTQVGGEAVRSLYWPVRHALLQRLGLTVVSLMVRTGQLVTQVLGVTVTSM
jgi:hypothetical protein